MNKEKLEKLLSDIDMEILSDLKKSLAEEMSKPTVERDDNSCCPFRYGNVKIQLSQTA